MDTPTVAVATEHWITTAQAAERAGVTRRSILKWIEAGLIAVRELPHAVRRVRWEDVDRVVNAGTRTTPAH